MSTPIQSLAVDYRTTDYKSRRDNQGKPSIMPNIAFRQEKTALLAAALMLISGCVSVTKPVPIGEGRYMISLNAHGGFHGNGELLQETTQHANEFCAEQGKNADIVTAQATGVQMWTPQDNQVVFTCTSHG